MKTTGLMLSKKESYYVSLINIIIDTEVRYAVNTHEDIYQDEVFSFDYTISGK